MLSDFTDFFENQEYVRKKISAIYTYYIVSIICIVFTIDFSIAFILTVGHKKDIPITFSSFFSLPRLLIISVIVIGWVVTISSLFMRSVAKGGIIFASRMGGDLVNPNSSDPNMKIVLDVVEELSIATGLHLPPVSFLRENKTMNAFAVGFYMHDTVVGITKGAVDNLSKEEIQSVMAHEFSHILNGDTAIKLRVVGLISGLTKLHFIGWSLFIMTVMSGGMKKTFNSLGNNIFLKLLFVLGMAIMLCGYIGIFFSGLIIKKISRENEYLADLSAAQITKKPLVLAETLKKINTFNSIYIYNKIFTPQTNFIFFSPVTKGFIGRYSSTHPSTEDRMERLKNANIRTKGYIPINDICHRTIYSFSEFSTFNVSPVDVISSIGLIEEEHIKYAQRIIKMIPTKIHKIAREPEHAETIIYAFLLDEKKSIRRSQLVYIRTFSKKIINDLLKDNIDVIDNLPIECRLPLIYIAVGSLRFVDYYYYLKVADIVKYLSEIDGKISLLEFTIEKMFFKYLEPVFKDNVVKKHLYKELSEVDESLQILLSMLAYFGIDEDERQKEQSFYKALSKIEYEYSLKYISPNEIDLNDLDKALTKLDNATPLLKKKIIYACLVCVISDGCITKKQSELVQLIADNISCPIPPLLPTKE